MRAGGDIAAAGRKQGRDRPPVKADEPQKKQQEQEELEREKKMQKAVLDIKKKYGKNAILKGMNLQEGATAVERNSQIGGHKA